MFIPDSFPPSERRRIRDRFFGQGDISICIAVITPLEFLFNELGRELRTGEGWWKSRYGHGVLVTHTPQSSAITDPISALEPGTIITMLGIAGSVGDLQIGDIVEASSGLSPADGTCYPRSYLNGLVFPAAKIATVESLAQSRQIRHELTHVVDCVDMETALVYATAKRQGHFARSIQIITDDEDEPFFAAKLSRIESSVQKVSDSIERYIETAGSANKSNRQHRQRTRSFELK